MGAALLSVAPATTVSEPGEREADENDDACANSAGAVSPPTLALGVAVTLPVIGAAIRRQTHANTSTRQ